MGYSAAENGLCVVGGAPLPLDDRLTLAQCGIRANSSVQVAGRLLGGVKVTIRGRKHAVDARGSLDLRDQNLGPAGAKEVGAFLATSAGGAPIDVLVERSGVAIGTRVMVPDHGEGVYVSFTRKLIGKNVHRVRFGDEEIDIHWIDGCKLVYDATHAGAAVARLSLSRNLITGSTRIGYSDAKYDNDLSGLISLCDALLTLTNPIKLDLSNCGLSVNGAKPVAKAISAGAAVTSINCLHNPLGEAVHIIIKVFEETPRLRTLCGFEEGVEQIDWSKSRKGPVEVALLAAEIKAGRAITAVASLDCSQNDAITGKRVNDARTAYVYGEQLEGWQALCSSLSGTSITSVNFSKCGLTLPTLTPLADAINLMAAAVEVVILDGNPIGCPLSTSTHLKPGAVTGIRVKKGVFAVVDGRFGEVSQDLDYASGVKLRWLDDGSESNYITVNKLTSVVATRSDLIEDYSHIRCLGEALSGSKVHTYGFANCKFNPVSLATFVESVRWAEAAVDIIDLSGCGLTGATKTKYIGDGKYTWEKIDSSMDGFIALCAVIGNVHTIRLADCGLGPDSAVELSKVFTNADAAVTSMNCLHNPLGEAVHIIIKVFEETPRLRTLCGFEEGVEQIDWSKSWKGPVEVALLAAEIKAGRAIGAVEAMAIGANPITPEGGAILLDTIKTSKLKTIDIGKPLPLQEPYESDTLDLSNTQMDPGHVLLLSWWLGTEFSGAPVEVVILDGNPIGYPSGASLRPGAMTGATAATGAFAAVGGRWGEITYIGEVDAKKPAHKAKYCSIRWLDDGSGRHVIEPVKFDDNGRHVIASRTDLIEDYSHIRSLGEALSGSKVHTYGLADCKFNPATLATFVESVRWETAAVTSINCLHNPLGEAVHIIIKVFEETPRLRTLCGFEEGVEQIDWSKSRKGLVEVALLATEIRAGRAIGAVNSLTIDSTGNNFKPCLPKTYTLTAGQEKIDLSQKNLGSADVTLLTSWLQRPEVTSALNSVTIDSTGVMGTIYNEERDDFEPGQKPYTLTTGEEKIDLSKKNLGSADVALVATWLQRPEVMAAVARLVLNGAQFGPTYMVGAQIYTALTECLQRTTASMASDPCGSLAKGTTFKVLATTTLEDGTVRLQTKSGWLSRKDHLVRMVDTSHPCTLQVLCDALKASKVTEVDFSRCGLGSPAIEILSGYVCDATATVARLVLNGNMITGSSQDWRREWTYDLDLSGLIALCDALPVLNNPIALGLAHCGLSANGVNLLAETIGAGAIDGIDLSGCRVEPTVSAQVLNAASDASRRRLRTAQVLAFSFALHDRLGASTTVCELVDKGVVDILRIVSSIVHSRQGHEALCSALARRHPWYEVVVRGLIPKGVPHR